MTTVRELAAQVIAMRAPRATRPDRDEVSARRETVRRQLARMRANLLAEPGLLPEPDLLGDEHAQRIAERNAARDDLRTLIDDDAVREDELLAGYRRYRVATLRAELERATVGVPIDEASPDGLGESKWPQTGLVAPRVAP